MALILPAAFAAVFLLLGNLYPAWGWRRAFLRAAVLWGIWLVLVTELLSPFRAVTRMGLSVAWAIPFLGCTAALSVRRLRGIQLRLPRLEIPRLWPERLLLASLAAILAVTAVIAWAAPPSTWDSLNYHMARVAHWAQIDGVSPFATGIEVQNSRSPGAEMAVLHTFVLAGGDRLANFVEWAAMLGSLVGVSLIASQLGGRTPAQLLAALIAATLPTGLAQASSTMTDYVVALWVVIAASEALSLAGDEAAGPAAFFAAAAAGLGLLTKPTAAAYLVPFGVLAGIYLVTRRRPAQTARAAVMALILVVAINAGHLWRTQRIYGTLFDPGQVAVHANQERNLRGLASNLVRNLALNAGTPSPHVNKAIYRAVVAFHDWIGLDPSDPRTTSAGEFRVRVPSTHEDLASNPVHALLYLVVMAWVALRWRSDDRGLLIYLLASASTLIFLSAIFKWQIFGGRYQLPLFVLLAPAAGFVLTARLSARAWQMLAALLVVASWPWLTGIRSRPLTPTADLYVGSVLTESRDHLYFANALYLEDTFTSLAGLVQDAGCSDVGIVLSGNAPEYLLWVVMGAPGPDLRIEWIVGGTPSARYEDPSFAPCAVVCDESCPADWTMILGLPLVYQRSGYRLFLQPTPAP